MNSFGLAIRDTFSWENNLDDFQANGAYGGPRRVQLEISDDPGYAHIRGRRYEIPGRQCVAYDSYALRIPKRLIDQGRDDPIVHEAVHFLQWNTTHDDDAYREYNAAGTLPALASLQYWGQRVESEAHVVQIAYIMSECADYRDRKLTPAIRERVEGLLADMRAKRSVKRAIEAIGICNKAGLI